MYIFIKECLIEFLFLYFRYHLDPVLIGLSLQAFWLFTPSIKIIKKRATEIQALIFYLQDLVLLVSSVPL
ncbi:hypothetical protein HCUR_01081 [Holospora curviuscula]|uniref:Uncharacterized protein n=1 Tax=Holospora curviuscula TaxID=1082868 RepID=A0A2S5R827_9PROT|nr:hypothetical protein HCUR_01081 [Holospora curviuscula]